MRLPKSKRLTRWGDFANVRESGSSAAGKFLVLGTTLRTGSEGIRVGFVTSKRVGNAVVRNRVRRKLRAVVRELGDRIRGGVDIVTVARYRAGSATFDQLLREWRWLARKMEILEDGKVSSEAGEVAP